MTRDASGGVRCVVEGMERARVVEIIETEPGFRARVEYTPDEDERHLENEALVRSLIRAV